jgi:hypothetical protein
MQWRSILAAAPGRTVPSAGIDEVEAEGLQDAGNEEDPLLPDVVARVSPGEVHLLLAFRSPEQRQAEFWETVAFLAIWLSGLTGIAICVL